LEASVDPFDDLVALQRHHEEIADSPSDWSPWTYKDIVARIAQGPRLTCDGDARSV
jgi:hypothetical protein